MGRKPRQYRPNREDTIVNKAHWLTTYDPNNGEPIGSVCSCEIGANHDGDGNLN